MRSLPADLLIVSPEPHGVLRRLGDRAQDLTVVTEITQPDRLTTVLLSGPVTPDAVALVAAEMAHRPVTVAVDLLAPPPTAALASLAPYFQDEFETWGEQPVALVVASGARQLDPALLCGLAPLLAAPAAESVDLATAALAQADVERGRLAAQVSTLDEKLAAQRSRLDEIVRQRDEALQRERALSAHPALRASRLLGAVSRRLPGRRATVAVLAVLAAAAGIALAVLVATGGRTTLGIGIGLLTLGVTLNLAVALATALVLLRHSGRAAASAADLRQVVASQRRSAAEVHSIRRDLERHRKVSRERHANVSQRFRNLNTSITRERRLRGADLRNNLAQTQAALRLFSSIPVNASVPPMGGWAASADLVSLLVDEFVERRPRLVVECGSGVSTLWLALAARHHGIPTRIVALDHDAHYAAQTRALVARHGVADLVDVRHAPLRMTDVDGTDQLWYHSQALEGLSDIGLLFVDGPPAATGELARYPAVPALVDRFAPGCTIVLDDMQREDDQRVALGWRDRLADFTRTDVPLEKGATVFRRDAADPGAAR